MFQTSTFSKLTSLIAVSAMLVLSPKSEAQILHSYSGGADPTTQQWVRISGGNSGLSEKSDTYNGVPVWSITSGAPTIPNDSQQHHLTYRGTISKLQDAENFRLGWSLKATLQVPDARKTPTTSIMLVYETSFRTDGTQIEDPNTSWSYRVLFGSEEGKTTVALADYAEFIYVHETDDFIDVELRYTPGADGVHLYINNHLMVSDYLGTQINYKPNPPRISWGRSTSTQSSYTTSANWASVEFSTIPEPSTTAFLLVPLAAFAFFGSRRMFKSI